MSALTVTQFKAAVWNFISSQVVSLIPSGQVIWMEQGSPRPKLSYVGLKIITGPRTYGNDDMRQTTSPGVYSIEGQRALTISVNVFGRDAEQIAALIINGMCKPSTIDSLTRDSIAILTNTSPQNVSVPLETIFENRVQFDIDFGCVMAVLDDVGIIEHTGILNTTSGERTQIG